MDGERRYFTITELQRIGGSDGKIAYNPTGVRFSWSADNYAAPRGTWRIPVKQRTVRHDYPGSEAPSEQVLGWNYEAFTLQGVWDDRYMGAGVALETWAAFEALVKRGNMLRFEFEGVSINGIITDFDADYRRADFVGWSFTVSPHFRRPNETVRVEAPAKRRLATDPRTLVNNASVAFTALTVSNDLARGENLSRVQATLKTDIFAEVGAILDEIDSYLSAATNVVEGQILQLTGPEISNAFGRLVQTMANTKRAARALNALVDNQDSGQIALTSAAAILDFETWRRGVSANSRALLLISEGARQEAEARSVARVKRLHRARQGESLYTISTLYYNTPHNWRAIAERNGLTALILEGSELLVIPEL